MRAADDQRAAQIDARGRRNPEGRPIDHLGDEKEKRDIDAEKPAEIPGRQIDDDAIEEQDDGAAGEKTQANCQGRAMQP